MTGSKADYLLLLPTVYSKVFTQQLLLLVLFQLVLGLFSLEKKQIFRNSQPSFPLFFRKKNQFSQSEITFYPAPPRTRRLRGKFQQVDRQTYVAHIPPLRGWYSRDALGLAHTGIKSLSREHEGTLTQTALAITMQIPFSAKPWFPPVGGIFGAGGTPLGKCRTPFRLIKINWGFCFIKAPEFNAWAGGGYTELWCLVGIWGPHTRQHSWAPGCFATLVVCSLVMCFF